MALLLLLSYSPFLLPPTSQKTLGGPGCCSLCVLEPQQVCYCGTASPVPSLGTCSQSVVPTPRKDSSHPPLPRPAPMSSRAGPAPGTGARRQLLGESWAQRGGDAARCRTATAVVKATATENTARGNTLVRCLFAAENLFALTVYFYHAVTQRLYCP